MFAGICTSPFQQACHLWGRTVRQTRQLKRPRLGMAQTPCRAAEASICMQASADETRQSAAESVKAITLLDEQTESRSFGTVLASICSPVAMN